MDDLADGLAARTSAVTDKEITDALCSVYDVHDASENARRALKVLRPLFDRASVPQPCTECVALRATEENLRASADHWRARSREWEVEFDKSTIVNRELRGAIAAVRKMLAEVT